MAEQVKKRNIFVRIGGWFKAAAYELKKVTWPGFKTVVKQTGVVLGVTLFFLLILFGIDMGFGQLYKLLMSGFDTTEALVRSL